MTKTKSKKRKSVPKKKEASYQGYAVDIGQSTGVPQPEPFDSLVRAYESHVWVYNCVKAIATNLASIPILPYIQKVVNKKPSWVVNEKHELRALIDKPNPYMSGYNLREYTAAAMELTGNAYWFLEDMGTEAIKEIWPLLPDQVKPVAAADKMISHYVYRVGMADINLPYDRVIHFRFMNPQSFIYGQGALSAAKISVMTDIFAQVWNKKFFQNAARPDVVLTTDNVLDDDVRARVITSWRQIHEGYQKQGKTALLEQGIKAQPLTIGSKDMDFVNLRKDLRNEILAAFGVPPSVVGLLEFANYSNMDAQLKMFWTQTVMPLLRNIEDTLTMRAEQITFEYGTVFQGDTSNVLALRPDMKMLADTAQVFVNTGIPLNRVIELLDLPIEPVEGGDQPRLPAAPNPFGGLSAPNSDQKMIKAKKDAARFARWKAIDDKFREHEAKFKLSIAGFFRSQQTRVLKRLQENAAALLAGTIPKALDLKSVDDSIDIIFDLSNEETLMKKTAGKLIEGTFFDFAVRMTNQINPTFDYNITDPVANQWIASKTFKLVQEANRYTLETIKDEVKASIQDAVASGFSAGETIGDISDRIKSVYDFAVEGRADRIARTEVISSANAGSFDAMKKAGIERKEWLSSQDDHVRDTHVVLDGQDKSLDEYFISPSGSQLMFPGDPEADPSETINCFLPDTIVEGSFLSGVRSKYIGSAVDLVTGSGKILSVTPNHPIFTTNGFVPASSLCKGDYAICYSGVVNPKMSVSQTNQNQKPVTIEDVFNSIRIRTSSFRRHLTPDDFHGDARNIVGEVDIIRADCVLRDEFSTKGRNSIKKFPLVHKNMGRSLLSGFGSETSLAIADRPASAGIPSRGELTGYEIGRLFNGGPLQSFRFGSASQFDSQFLEMAHEGRSNDSRLIGNLLERFAGLIFFDEIVDVRYRNYSGNVYDLQSVSGLLVAGGILSHNCRCTVINPDR